MRSPQQEENSPSCNRLVLTGSLMPYQDGSEHTSAIDGKPDAGTDGSRTSKSPTNWLSPIS